MQKETKISLLVLNKRRTKWPFMAIATLALFFTMQSSLPAYASLWSRASMTTAEEEELGDEFLRNLMEQCELVEDPSIVGYVNKIGQRIVREYESPPFAFKFYVIKEDVYNAFASPGGHVFIYSGLLAAMENEEELAGLLGHEIAHVLCRHISKRIEQSKRIGLVTLAGVLTGIFLGGNPDLSGAITTGSLAAGQSLALKYSREDERQADQVGLKYLAKAGYGPEGLLTMLKKIREKRWFGSEQIPSYVTTHPAIEERMAYLDTWVESHPEWKTPTKEQASADFHKMQTKLIALYGDPSSAWNAFKGRLTKNPQDALGYYGKGILLFREGKREEAVESLQKALELRPLDEDILRDLGKIYFQMGDYRKASQTLMGALAFYPGDLEGQLLLGRSQAETGDLEKALETLKNLMHSDPDYLPAVYYVGETYGKLGNLPEAHYHIGMYHKKRGELKKADFHLKRALKLFDKDPARKQEIEEALKELSEDLWPYHNGRNVW